MKVYIGSALKVEAWRDYIDKIENLLKELGCETWNPYKDAGLLTPSVKKDPQKFEKILQMDLDAFHECDAALFILDEKHEGTILELGYVVCLKEKMGKDIEIIGLCTNIKGIELLDSMVRYCCQKYGRIVSTLDELKVVIKQILGEGKG